MGNFYNTQSHGGCECNCNNRNMIIIFAAIIALILVNVLEDDTTECLGQFFQALGDLMSLSVTGGCFNHFSNNCIGNNNSGCGCNYY